jgi:SAM-dependent methyltransferase
MSAALSSPAVARNRDAILDVLRPLLAPGVRVLEVAAGSGEHALWFSTALPEVPWLPTDASPAALASIEAWRSLQGPPNLQAALALDAADPASWPEGPFGAVVCINMMHISPWAATLGLLAGAARSLAPGGVLVLYGPFREADAPFAPSNAAFDADLRTRNPEWGVRELSCVVEAAGAEGLHFEASTRLPANNLAVVFRAR